MADESIPVTISGKENVEWIRMKVAEGRFRSEAEAVNESLSMLREDELDLQSLSEGLAQRSAEYQGAPSIGFTDRQVGESLVRARREREIVAQRHAEHHANPSLVMTDEEVERSLAEDRLDPVEHAA